MVNTLQTILTRRSIRKYKSESIPGDIVRSLLQAAMSAPSACNQQPWHFVVIDDKETIQKIASIHSGLNSMEGSPMSILVCGEPGAAVLDYYWEQDCSAATQNILLAAHALGLGAVWRGINPRGGEDSEIVGRLTGLPGNIRPFSIVTLGYPAEQHDFRDQFCEDRIHYKSRW